MPRTWMLGSVCVLIALAAGTGDSACAQAEFDPLNPPEDVFRETGEQELGCEQLSAQFPAAPLLQRLPPPQDEFAVGVAADGRMPRVRPRSLGGGPGGEERAPFRSRLFWVPAQPIQGQSNDLALSGAELGFGVPLRIDEDGIWLALGGVQRLDLQTSAVLPDSGLPVPNELWDIEAGVMHVRELGDGRQAGGMVRIGSPSDRPFGAWRDLTVTFLGFYTIPARDNDAWSFSLFYSPTGQIIFPIPGVAYNWRPNEQFRANVGIPFSVEYRPTESTILTASYMPLNNVQVLLRQSLGQSWSVYGGYRTVSETFLLSHREDDRERTYLFDQRLTLGVQRELGRGWSVDLSTAYLFDRRFFQAEKFSGSRRDELSLDPGLAGTLQLMWSR